MGGLTGDWRGVYVNEGDFAEDGGHEFGIEATLIQAAGRLQGTMTDLQSVRTYPLRRLLDTPGNAKWSRRRWLAPFLERYPDAILRSVLPERSQIVGKNAGSVVEFGKRYLGMARTAYLSDDKEIFRDERPGHEVRYRGTLSAAEDEIVGEWWIPAKGFLRLLTKDLGRGTFRLTRKTDLV